MGALKLNLDIKNGPTEAKGDLAPHSANRAMGSTPTQEQQANRTTIKEEA